MLPTQGGVNVSLGSHLGSGLLSASVNLSVGLVLVLALRVLELLRSNRPVRAVLRYAPPAIRVQPDPESPVNDVSLPRPSLSWAVLAGPGVIGAVVVLSTILLIAQLGFAIFFVTNVSSSMVTSVLVDHTGFLGTLQKRIGVWSAVGVALTVVGAVLYTSAGYSAASNPALTPLAVLPGMPLIRLPSPVVHDHRV
jgi:uncharacterized membrane protein YdcZ (DUF606 family)